MFFILPIFFLAVALAIKGLSKAYSKITKKTSEGNLNDKVKVTILVMIYLIYPLVVNLSFSFFNCKKLDDGVSYLKRDFSV
jgi:hypothetical protein